MNDDSEFNLFPATSTALLAGSFYLEKLCKRVNDRFMSCRKKKADPELCESEAIEVFACTKKLFKQIKSTTECVESWGKLVRCLDCNNQNFIYCREEEASFDECARKNMALGKDLWVGQSAIDKGVKEPNEWPEAHSWAYKWHVWNNKWSN